VIFFNFRADRARQISEALALPSFKEFETPVKVKTENWICFTEYQKNYPFPILFAKQSHTQLLGEIVARQGWKQLRVAETEKYAHVTYFFNGGEEKPYENEDRILVQSPKDVKTYDLKPEMSAFEIRDHVLTAMTKDYRMIVVNFANGDMVGHTGNEAAAVKAVETLDKCLCSIVEKAISSNWDVLISADHGNCEEMINPETGEPFTQHTTNPVPLVWIGPESTGAKLKDGILADIAPTMLKIWNLKQPKEMTGQSLIV
jgi:2,3-bisphosphoglycerate-independent phosphoglycerate mutase